MKAARMDSEPEEETETMNEQETVISLE